MILFGMSTLWLYQACMFNFLGALKLDYILLSAFLALYHWSLTFSFHQVKVARDVTVSIWHPITCSYSACGTGYILLIDDNYLYGPTCISTQPAIECLKDECAAHILHNFIAFRSNKVALKFRWMVCSKACRVRRSTHRNFTECEHALILVKQSNRIALPF